MSLEPMLLIRNILLVGNVLLFDFPWVLGMVKLVMTTRLGSMAMLKSLLVEVGSVDVESCL